MNCSEAKCYENYLTSDFHTNTVISLVAYRTHQDGFQNRDKVYLQMEAGNEGCLFIEYDFFLLFIYPKAGVSSKK